MHPALPQSDGLLCTSRLPQGTTDFCLRMISESMSTSMKAKKRAMAAVMSEMKANAATGTVEKKLQPTKLSKKVRAKQNDPFEDAVAPVKAAPKKRVRDSEAPAPKATKPKKPKVVEVVQPRADDSESDDGEDEDKEEDEEAAAVPTLADDSRGDPSLALDQFDLSDETVGALRARGVDALFPIQAATFNLIYEGNDVIGRARTGMGKTLAFALPTIERIFALRASGAEPGGRGTPPVAIVLSPTRELANQIHAEAVSYTHLTLPTTPYV